jgi:hypothetical protein
MARVDAAGFAEKWARRLKGAGTDIQNGIKRVTTAPGVKAAAQVQAMRNNLNARIDDGTWGRRTAAVSLNDWQQAALTKGVQRISQGVDGAGAKVTEMAGKLLAAVDQSVAVVDRTPRGDLSTNIGRAVTFMTEMSNRAPKRAK